MASYVLLERGIGLPGVCLGVVAGAVEYRLRYDVDRSRRWLKAKLEVAPHPAYRLRKLRLYVSAPSPITHTHPHTQANR
jgi:hypothetical protein